MRGKQNATGWGFLAPAIILITLFSLYPMISALITSFQTGTGTNMKFCSFSNYIRCLQDDVFVQSIKNCVFYLIIQVPVMLVLALIFASILNNPKVKLLSHTVFPETDSVPALKAYAIEHKVDDKQWNLVTGDKKEIYTMARKSYLAVKLGKPDELYDMVHTENFVLVDSKRRVRGFYDGTKNDILSKMRKKSSRMGWTFQYEYFCKL